jgi:hypothetical protein
MQAFISSQKFPTLFKKNAVAATPHIFGTGRDTITVYIYPRIEKIQNDKFDQDVSFETLELPDDIYMDCQYDLRKSSSVDEN